MNQARLGLAVIGFIGVLAAVYTNDRRLMSVAIGALIGSFLLRLVIRALAARRSIPDEPADPPPSE